VVAQLVESRITPGGHTRDLERRLPGCVIPLIAVDGLSAGGGEHEVRGHLLASRACQGKATAAAGYSAMCTARRSPTPSGSGSSRSLPPDARALRQGAWSSTRTAQLASTTGPQVLYQAIGAGNLRAYVQGQDDAGHAGLAN